MARPSKTALAFAAATTNRRTPPLPPIETSGMACNSSASVLDEATSASSSTASSTFERSSTEQTAATLPGSPTWSVASTLCESPQSSPDSKADTTQPIPASTLTAMATVAQSPEHQELAVGSGAPAALTTQPTWATAEDLPQELFAIIVNCVVRVSTVGNVITADAIRTMGDLALVSTWFAKVVRRFILREVWVKSQHTARLAQEILYTGSSLGFEDPANLIKTIHIVHDGTDTATLWSANIILMFNTIPALSQVEMDLTLERKDPSAVFGPSIFCLYPCKSPLLFRQFYRLTIRGAHFRLRSHFVKFVSEFRNLRWLYIEDLSWDDAAPHEAFWPWPYGLVHIYIREKDRYSNGGQGALPLFLKASCSFQRIAHRFKEQASLPDCLRPRPLRLSADYPVHPEQATHIKDLMYTFYAPRVSTILEGGTALSWTITRLQCGKNMPTMPQLNIFGRQKFPNLDRDPFVTPCLMVHFDVKADSRTGRRYFFVTRIHLDTAAHKPTIEELLMYDWGNFFYHLAEFEHLKMVEFKFINTTQRSRMVQEYQQFLPSPEDTSRTFVYLANDDKARK